MRAGHVALEHGVQLKRVMAVVRTLVSAGTSEPPGSVAHSCAALSSRALCVSENNTGSSKWSSAVRRHITVLWG